MTLVVTPAALMWRASQVAKRDGISVQAVTRKVRHLAEKHGLTIERDSRGRIVAFNIAQYDHLRNRYADPSKAQVASAPSMDGTANSYDEALRQKTWIEAERARLKLDEERGELRETCRTSRRSGTMRRTNRQDGISLRQLRRRAHRDRR